MTFDVFKEHACSSLQLCGRKWNVTALNFLSGWLNWSVPRKTDLGISVLLVFAFYREAGAEQKFKDISNAYEVTSFIMNLF